MIDVREATYDDLERMDDLLEEWIGEMNPDGLNVDPKVPILRKTFRNMRNMPSCCVLVMVDDGKIVGCLGLIQHGWGVCETQNFATENLWFIAKSHGGYARNLIAAAKAWARRRGCDYLIFSTNRLSTKRAEKGDEFLGNLGFRPLYNLHITEVSHV